jgi:hypothetical protein
MQGRSRRPAMHKQKDERERLFINTTAAIYFIHV